jgi:hypothetical protein
VVVSVMALEDTCAANLEMQNQQEQIMVIITSMFPKVSVLLAN